ncbi:oligosaccharide flippase family protein [Thiopseudomonas alkaliphila]|uniref:Oligosaccharide flippase family protein n=1 Tax=Thiopseudomonas alkaliphila TaxID=1697053 RepID=A0AAW7DN43_9GAMM|nr:oligosaccharide flippase family protein [Thiopseudomonas alkaliphila]MDM1695101.1 oligosaccharide flippase family protein [Thiopseudomonas alkaliphila]
MLKKQLQKIWQNRLVKSVLVVASGTAGAQAIGMAFVPFITRTYGPEVYGTLGAFIALTGVLTTLAALAYPVAIVLPKSDSKAKALVKLSLLIAATISLLVFITLWLAGDWILPKVGAASLMGFMFFIPLVMFFTACQDISQQWLIRKKAFKGIANISIAHSIINYGSQTLAGLYAPLAGVLIGIHSFSIAVRSLLTGFVGRKLVNKEDADKVPLKQVAYEYRDFPMYRAPQVVLNAASQSLPVLMLATFFGPAAAGFYVLARTMLGIPSTLIATSVQNVFYPYFNETINNNENAFPLLFKATLILAAIGVWPTLIVFLFGGYIFGFVFGSGWEEAGCYAKWISFWVLSLLVSRPAISIIPIIKKQKWFLKYEIYSLFFKAIGVFIVFLTFEEPNGILFAASYSLFNFVLYVFLVAKVLIMTSVYNRSFV